LFRQLLYNSSRKLGAFLDAIQISFRPLNLSNQTVNHLVWYSTFSHQSANIIFKCLPQHHQIFSVGLDQLLVLFICLNHALEILSVSKYIFDFVKLLSVERHQGIIGSPRRLFGQPTLDSGIRENLTNCIFLNAVDILWLDLESPESAELRLLL